MPLTIVPQSSFTANRQSANQRAGQRSGMLVAYLLLLAVIATSLTVVYGRTRHHERGQWAVPGMSQAGEHQPANSVESKAATEGDDAGEEESLPASGEEKHNSIGDDVIVLVER